MAAPGSAIRMYADNRHCGFAGLHLYKDNEYSIQVVVDEWLSVFLQLLKTRNYTDKCLEILAIF